MVREDGTHMPQLDSMVHKTFSVFAPELFAENVFSTDYAALAFLLRVRRPLHSKRTGLVFESF
jgi:hypothetical protein